MRKLTMLSMLVLPILPAVAQDTGFSASSNQPTFTEWHDMQVNDINRLPLHTSFFAYESKAAAKQGNRRASDNYLSLEGNWKFNYVENADQRPTTFFELNYDDSSWGNMSVPGLWELNGYGDPVYVNIGFPWRGHFDSKPPQVPTKDNHVGSYRRIINIPQSWDGRQVIAHFGSVTSNIYLWVNGEFAGYAEDSKMAAEFDITPYLRQGQNLIAFQTFRWCDGTYCEDQDFWRLSGVARESYLYARDVKTHINDVRITPTLVNNYTDGELDVKVDVEGNCNVLVTLLDADGRAVVEKELDGVIGSRTTKISVSNPKKWTAETPYLYTLLVSPVDYKGNATEVVPQKVGFRKIELRNAMMLINDQAVYIKGVDRHELDPYTGYVVSRERMIEDIKVMKRFNINAVRTCHYADDPEWYDLCDEYGIYLCAEANQESHGFGYSNDSEAKKPQFALQILQRNQHNVSVNFNHPSVIMWSMGNETVDGPNFTAAYKWIKQQDPSRPIHFEQARSGENTDIRCPMYPSQEWCERYAKSQNPEDQKPLILCEYSHAMGNSCGGFKEYWDLVRRHYKFQGGFIWDFADQALHGKDAQGHDMFKYGGDYNSYDASDNNFNCNGLFSPDRVPNPHAYEVGYYYQNIWPALISAENGKTKVRVKNEFFFRDLSNVKMVWALMVGGQTYKSGEIEDLDIKPQEYADLLIPCDLSAAYEDEPMLNIDFKLKNDEPLMEAGQTIAYDQLRVLDFSFNSSGNLPWNKSLSASDSKKNPYLYVKCDGAEVGIDRNTGLLTMFRAGGVDLLAEGGCMKPNFWRGVTDNDMGAGLNRRYSVWRDPAMNLKSMTHKKVRTAHGKVTTNDMLVTAVFDMPTVKGTLTIEYLIDANGKITVTESFKANGGTDVPNPLRFGMVLQMPNDMDQSHYYGRGPVENYADRKFSQRIGIYTQTADEQFYPYIRPQETGTKSDMRWWLQASQRGVGIKVQAEEEPFFASALHYDISQLDDGDNKEQRHTGDLKKASYTNLFIDGQHAGVGGVDTWSGNAEALKKYRVPYGDLKFVFSISPVKPEL